jgi:hypothetical protein
VVKQSCQRDQRGVGRQRHLNNDTSSDNNDNSNNNNNNDSSSNNDSGGSNNNDNNTSDRDCSDFKRANSGDSSNNTIKTAPTTGTNGKTTADVFCAIFRVDVAKAQKSFDATTADGRPQRGRPRPARP